MAESFASDTSVKAVPLALSIEMRDDNGSDQVSQAAPASKVSGRQLTVNLIAGGLGVGMFSLPSTMAGCSVISGTLMTFAVVALNAMTIMILVSAAEAHQVFDLGALMGLLPRPLGPSMQVYMNVMVWVVMFGSLISYIIVMSDSILKVSFVEETWPDARDNETVRAALVSFCAMVVLFLSFLDQRHLSCTSGIALLVNVYLIVVLFIIFSHKGTDDDPLPSDVCYLGIGRGSISMLAVLAQCIIIQMCVLPMYEELQDRSPLRFRRCLYIAFGVLAVIFSVFASLGYMAFGPNVDGNVLKSFDKGVVSDIAQIGTVFVVSAVFPLMVIPMVAPVRNGQLSWCMRTELLVTVTIVTIVFISYLGALLISDLKIINIIGGALCVGNFTALAPGLVGLHLLNKNTDCWKFLMFVLFEIGVVNSVLGVVMTKPYLEDLKANCLLKA